MLVVVVIAMIAFSTIPIVVSNMIAHRDANSGGRDSHIQRNKVDSDDGSAARKPSYDDQQLTQHADSQLSLTLNRPQTASVRAGPIPMAAAFRDAMKVVALQD